MYFRLSLVTDWARSRHQLERLSAGPAAEDAHSMGGNDSLLVPAAAKSVKRVVPTAELRYFDGGHFAFFENADAFAEAIIETFSRADATRS
jgi:pimeloyl-ACP methyl ester carboxylesterase